MALVPTVRRGRWRMLVAAFLLTAGAAMPVFAQRVVPEVVVPPVSGAQPIVPVLPTSPELRVLPVAPAAPQLTPAMPLAPRTPAPIIRFRCEVEPDASTCREPGLPDGGGDDGTCDCARDFCYRDPAGVRICEKS